MDIRADICLASIPLSYIVSGFGDLQYMMSTSVSFCISY